jgi:hypothetical protein
MRVPVPPVPVPKEVIVPIMPPVSPRLMLPPTAKAPFVTDETVSVVPLTEPVNKQPELVSDGM